MAPRPPNQLRPVWLQRVSLLCRAARVGAVLLEQDEHWQLEGRRMFSAESMNAIPSLEDLPVQPSLQDTTA